MNKTEFQVALVRADMSLSELAEKIGMTRQNLSNKMLGKRDFKLSEIQKIADVLNLSEEGIGLIFFSKGVN